MTIFDLVHMASYNPSACASTTMAASRGLNIMSHAQCANRRPRKITLGNTYVNDGLFTVSYGGENAFTSTWAIAVQSKFEKSKNLVIY
jgi:hypothetical protein